MLNFNQLPFFKLIIPLIIGILLGVNFLQPLPIWGIGLVLLLLLLAHFAFLHFKPIGLKILYQALNALSFIFLGYASVIVNTQILDEQHFSKLATDDSYLVLKILDPLDEKAKSYKTFARVEQVVSNGKVQASIGKVLLYIEKDEKVSSIRAGQYIVAKNKVKSIKANHNPHQFSYSNYLANKNVFHQLYLASSDYKVLEQKDSNPIFWAKSLQVHLKQQLQDFKLAPQELAVANALLLGNTDLLDTEIREAYAITGTVHVLSVSGLHVGIFYMLFVWLFRFVKRNRRNLLLQTFLIILFLWAYALLTGLKPPVLRAATMFSLLTIGKLLDKQSVSLNLLFVSAFFLLLINPYLLFEIGFQLSYLALLGIFVLQQPIYNWFYFTNKIADTVWSLMSVSLAAQVFTLPVTLYYFHQIPVYFLLANILIVPLGSLVLYTGLSFFVLAQIGQNALSMSFAFVLKWLIFTINQINLWIAKLPYAVLKPFTISLFEVFIWFFLLLSIILFSYKRKQFIFGIGIALITLLSINIVEKMASARQAQFLVYNIPNTTAINFIIGRDSYLISQEPLNEEVIKKYILTHLWHLDIQHQHFIGISDSINTRGLFKKNNFVQFCGQTFALIDNQFRLPTNTTKRVQIDYLVLSANPREKLEDLLKIFECKQIIVDASNKFYLTKRWETKAINQSIPIFLVSKEGAFVKKMYW